MAQRNAQWVLEDVMFHFVHGFGIMGSRVSEHWPQNFDRITGFILLVSISPYRKLVITVALPRK